MILEYDRDVFHAGLSAEEFAVEDYFETAVYPFPAVSVGEINVVMDAFIQGEFEGLAYSLYVPREYDGSRSYPLVQFIADSWDVGADCKTSLAQGLGGVIWAFPEEQKNRPCFVLCPHSPGPTIIEDDYSTRPEFETAIRLLEHIVEKYHIIKTFR